MQEQPKVHITDTAVNDFVRVTGVLESEGARAEVAREFAAAHRVGSQESGAERWRGRRPRRLTFIVRRELKELVVVQVFPDHQLRQRVERERRIDLYINSRSTPTRLLVLDIIPERGGARVAYKLPGGRWAEALRGSSPAHVTRYRELDSRPEWLEYDF